MLEQLARGLTNKLLHAPMQALSNAGAAERAELLSVLLAFATFPTQNSRRL